VCLRVCVCMFETWRGRDREAGRDGRRVREKVTGIERQREIESVSERVSACALVPKTACSCIRAQT